MIAAVDASSRLGSLLPWRGTPIAVHQVRALLEQGCTEVWVRSETPELLAALPSDARIRVGAGPAHAAAYDCFRPIGAAGVDLRVPGSVPHQGWLLVRRPTADLVVFSEPLCVCPRWDTDYVHSYLVLGRDRGLMVDTGTGLGDILAQARAICPDLLVIHTHRDWDHVGGSGAAGRVLAWGRPQRVPMAALRRQLARRAAAPWRPDAPHGWPPPPPAVAPPPPELDLGGRRLRVLRAPGHTADGLAVYDPDSGDLFAGDALYAGLLYARNRPRFAATAHRLLNLEGLRRVWGGHGPVPASKPDVEKHGQLVQ